MSGVGKAKPWLSQAPNSNELEAVPSVLLILRVQPQLEFKVGLQRLIPFSCGLKSQCGVVVKSGRLVIRGTGFASPLLHMHGDLGVVTLL